MNTCHGAFAVTSTKSATIIMANPPSNMNFLPVPPPSLSTLSVMTPNGYVSNDCIRFVATISMGRYCAGKPTALACSVTNASENRATFSTVNTRSARQNSAGSRTASLKLHRQAPHATFFSEDSDSDETAVNGTGAPAMTSTPPSTAAAPAAARKDPLSFLDVFVFSVGRNGCADSTFLPFLPSTKAAFPFFFVLTPRAIGPASHAGDPGA
mmetsp:Transcript_5770/g.21817  ORF Transcript_5770/g.21817 Transcript_5770/m.21817 type:complete len:211 (-) Transcript_5770:1722-2354(-)